MIVIGMNGLKHSGKTEATKVLVRKFGFVEMKFAFWLKAMLRAIGLTDMEIEGAMKEESNPMLCGKTNRYAMETLGTDWGRMMIGMDFWVNLAVDRAKKSALPRIVFSDCRFPNEVKAIREEFGGVVWRLTRPGLVASDAPAEQVQKQVVPDLTIDNSGTLDDLDERISMIMLQRVHGQRLR